MTVIQMSKVLKTIFLAAAFIFICLSDLQAARIGVLKSRNLESYNSVITSFSIASHHKIIEYDMRNDVQRGKAVIHQLKGEKLDLILAVGPLAATLAAENNDKVPILFCMVPNPDSYGLKGSNVTGISLTIPLRTQLGTLRLMADEVRRVGVIYKESNSSKLLGQARKVAKRLGMSIVAENIDSTGEVSKGLGRLRGKVDALWVIPDNVVLNRSAHRVMVDFAIRNKIPFFSLTPKLVKAGALLSLSPDYAAIGKQAAVLARKIVDQRVNPSLIPITPPEGIKIAINLTTSKKIGVQCDIALAVFTYAAQHGFPIVVYK